MQILRNGTAYTVDSIRKQPDGSTTLNLGGDLCTIPADTLAALNSAKLETLPIGWYLASRLPVTPEDLKRGKTTGRYLGNQPPALKWDGRHWITNPGGWLVYGRWQLYYYDGQALDRS